jgi:hypothetical protein
MKKILSLFVLVVFLFILASCESSTSNTKVRVVGLSYNSSESTVAAKPSINSMRLFSNRLLADEVEEYIFPGDIMTFTVEIEDPNFEFISLLSIKFNDQTIRGNVDDSIIATRDCGANICVDFPFEITADKSEYTVQEVKFAKLNSDEDKYAIIDNQSAITVTLDVYTDDLFPYVLESIQTLNNAIQNMEYFEDGATVDINTWNRISVIEYSGRTFYISNYNGDMYLDSLQIISQDIWLITMESGCCFYPNQIYQGLYLTYSDYGYGEFLIKGPFIEFLFFESQFKNAYFYNEGNSIYLDLLGEKHFIIELHNSMRIMYFEPLQYT